MIIIKSINDGAKTKSFYRHRNCKVWFRLPNKIACQAIKSGVISIGVFCNVCCEAEK